MPCTAKLKMESLVEQGWSERCKTNISKAILVKGGWFESETDFTELGLEHPF